MEARQPKGKKQTRKKITAINENKNFLKKKKGEDWNNM